MNFEEFNLPPLLATAISKMGYTNPTPIQEKVIPLAMSGKDILASSHTGSGKTAAFAIPLLAKLMNTEEQDAILVLTPTRELATQVLDTFRSLIGGRGNLRTALLIGGDPIGKQFRDLRSNPRIIVGTPGRINDHLKRKTLKLSNAKFLVLDEVDRMLDMGFKVPLDTIVHAMPSSRQTLMFSATVSKQIVELSQKYLDNPERVKIASTGVVAPNIKQENINVTEHNKYSTLVDELDKREGSILIFVKTKHSAQALSDKLVKQNHLATAIHGDLRQRQRDNVMKSFRNKTSRIMVATDVASRGLDILHIEHVINYDPPQLAEDCVHRIGRTARGGGKGSSLNFISQKDGKKWHEINRMLAGNEPKPLDMNPRTRSDNKRYQPKPRAFGGPERKSFGNYGARPDRARSFHKPEAHSQRDSEGTFTGERPQRRPFHRDNNESRPSRVRSFQRPGAHSQRDSEGTFTGERPQRRPFHRDNNESRPSRVRSFQRPGAHPQRDSEGTFTGERPQRRPFHSANARDKKPGNSFFKGKKFGSNVRQSAPRPKPN